MIFADLHSDTVTALDPGQWREGEGQISWRKLKEAGYGLQCVAVFQPYERGDLFDNFMRYASLLDESVEQNADLVVKVTDTRGIEEAVGAGKVALMLTIEEGGTMEGSIDKLHALYERGVRMMTLTWNYPNELGYPNLDIASYKNDRLFSLSHTDSRGLTSLGIETVAEMDRLGMIVDVSHLSDGGFWDVVRYGTKPFVASHSNAREVCGVARNLTDPMLKALAEKGGVAGLNLCPDFLRQGEGDLLQASLAHVKHVLDVAGEDVLALGTDYDGIHPLSPLVGCETTPLLADYLSRSIPSRVVDKMMWSNPMRVFADVIG